MNSAPEIHVLDNSLLSTLGGRWNDAAKAPITSLMNLFASNAHVYVQMALTMESARQVILAAGREDSQEGLLPDEVLKKVVQHLTSIDMGCESLKLKNTSIKIAYMLSLYRYRPVVVRVSGALQDFEHLRLEFLKELYGFKFLRLSQYRSTFMVGDDPEAQPFGLEVADAFPSAALDIREASNAFALSRWHACVFHLMRVLEIGLRTMAEKFEVPYESSTWHVVIEEIEGKVRRITKESHGDDWKQIKRDYSGAATQFMFFKDAWRNHIMHVRDVYDEGRATSIWQHVKEFMLKLANIGLHEEV